MKPKPANTPLEKLWQNTKDIEILKQQIAPLYKCSVDLSDSSTACDVADTNLTENVEKAFIIDTKGNIYKFIAFNEDKTIAYIEFYSNIKGTDGQDGRDGADDIDDTTTANKKLWSSQKTKNEIDLISDKGIYYTLIKTTLTKKQIPINSEIKNTTFTLKQETSRYLITCYIETYLTLEV